MPAGNVGSRAPAAQDLADIEHGLGLLRAIGPYDVGQGAVVANKHVLAVEAAEGTDSMLARVAELRARGRIPTPAGEGVLVKAPKPNQERRIDLPTIGPRTVSEAARAGLAGIAIVAGEAIIAEPAAVAAAADREKVFVFGIGAPQ
jgi:UDP-2,3-diacylglucosamine hydrolase